VHYVYLIESSVGKQRYVGYSEAVEHRLADHNAGKNVSTAPYRPWRLRAFIAFESKSQALGFERYLKSGSGRAFATKRFW